MKCLSLAQPMASAIFELGDDWKRVENRRRGDGKRPANIVNHRGPLLIHASRRWIPEHFEWITERKLQRSGPDHWTGSAEWARSKLPAGRIIGVVDVEAEVYPSGHVFEGFPDDPDIDGDRLLTDAERRWWMGGYGLVFSERRAFPSHGRTRFKDDPPALWPALARPGALGIFTVPDEVAGGAERCPSWSTTTMPGPLARCVFGVGHECPHANAEGFGWT